MIRAMFNWLVAEGILPVSPVKGLHVTVDPAQDRVREIVVPDFRFLDVLTSRLPTAEDRLIFELLLGTGGRRSEVAGIRIGTWTWPATGCGSASRWSRWRADSCAMRCRRAAARGRSSWGRSWLGC